MCEPAKGTSKTAQTREDGTAADLRRRLFHLQMLHDISREIAPLHDTRSILRVSALTVAGTMGTSLIVALLATPRDPCPEIVFEMGLGADGRAALENLRRQNSGLLENGRLVQPLSGKGEYPCAAELRSIGFRVWIRFRIQDGVHGVLGLGARLSGKTYGEDDTNLLETLQMLVEQTLSNAYLYETQRAANAALEKENHALEERVQVRTEALDAAKEVLSQSDAADEFIGTSRALLQVQGYLVTVAPSDLTVLIQGETGTGKGLAARTLHALSQRAAQPFIQVNCGAIPENLVESELFGHEKGAFTGADSRKLGKVELAQKGTLFLDEIGDMPLSAQVKLLRLLEERAFERLGGAQTLEVDARVVTATNRDLEQLVREGTFRQDLYFRLQVFPVRLPPLRERREDIPLLARYALERFARHLSRPVPELTPGALAHLRAYDWPGNVRELEHLLQRGLLLCRDGRIEPGDLGIGGSAPEAPSADGVFATLTELEKQHIEKALAATDGVIFGNGGAARLLGINPQTLRYRIRKLGIVRPGNGGGE